MDNGLEPKSVDNETNSAQHDFEEKAKVAVMDTQKDKKTSHTDSTQSAATEERKGNAKKVFTARLDDAVARDDFQGSLSVLHDKECMWYIGQEVVNAVYTKFVQPGREKDANFRIDFVAGVETQGFIFGPWIARLLDCGFVPVRLRTPSRLATETVSSPLEADNLSKSADSSTSTSKLSVGARMVKQHLCAEVNLDMFKRSSNQRRRPTVLLVDDFTVQGWALETAYKVLKTLDVSLVGIFVLIRGQDRDGSSRSLTFDNWQTEVLFDMTADDWK